MAAAWLLRRSLALTWPGSRDLPAKTAGYAVAIGGLILVVRGLAALFRARTTVRPDLAALPLVTALVTDGPFRHGRNPIYSGEILILLGFAQMTRNLWFIVLAVPFALLVRQLAVLPEERNDYRAYKARTRRWL